MKKILNKENVILFIISCIIVLPLALAVSPIHVVDGLPMLHRVMLLLQHQMTFDQFIFKAHGGSMHSIVYFFAWIDSLLFYNYPIMQNFLIIVGLIFTPLIIIIVMKKSLKNSFDIITMGIIIIVLISGSYTDQLYFPFQIVITATRLIYILLILGFIKCMEEKKYGWKYYILIIIASISTTMHGMGIVFAGAIVFLHIIYSEKIYRILISFIPFIVSHIIHELYNYEGYGEFAMAGGFKILLKYPIAFIRCLFGFYGMIFQIFKFSQKTVIILGAIIFFIITILLLLSFFNGIQKIVGIQISLPFFKFISIEPCECFMLTLLGMSFLSNFSQAMFTVARMELIDNYRTEPLSQVLLSTRYYAYSVIPIIYIIWKLFYSLPKVKYLDNIVSFKRPILVLMSCIMLLTNVLAFKREYTDNKRLDLIATGMLTGMSVADIRVEQFIFPGYTNDWYWVDEIPKMMNFFRENKTYIWHDIPDIRTVYDTASIRVPGNISEVVDIRDGFIELYIKTFDVPKYKRYCTLMSSDNIVIGFAYIDSFPHIEFNRGLFYNGKFILHGYIIDDVDVSDGIYIHIK